MYNIHIYVTHSDRCTFSIIMNIINNKNTNLNILIKLIRLLLIIINNKNYSLEINKCNN